MKKNMMNIFQNIYIDNKNNNLLFWEKSNFKLKNKSKNF